MIPQIPNFDNYIIVTLPDGTTYEKRAPLQQIEKNKDDIKTFNEKIENTDEWVSYLSADLDDRVRIPNPDVLPEDATPMCLTIDGQHQTSVKEYTSQPIPYSIAMRNDGGGININAQYGNKQYAANLQNVQAAVGMNYVDSFTANAMSYPYKPYRFAAKIWGLNTPEYSNAHYEITSIPTEAEVEWYQKICNGDDIAHKVVLRSALKTNSSRYKTSHCVRQFTDKVVYTNQEWEPGLHDFMITIQPHSSIEITGINRPTGYSQIFIT